MRCSLAMISILHMGKGSVPVNAVCSDPSLPHFCSVWWEAQFPRLYCSLALGGFSSGSQCQKLTEQVMRRSTGREGSLWCPWQLPQVLPGSCSGQET